MSEVTSSIEESTVLVVSRRQMKYSQSMSTSPLRRILCLTLLAGFMVLVAGEGGTDNEFNVTTSEMPVAELTSTEAAQLPLRKAVTDLLTEPLNAFKVQVPLGPPPGAVEDELIGLPLGKAENNTDATPAPPFSNLWFNAGQSLGSAANSLTGWLNNRFVTQGTSTTTKPPEIIVRVQSNQGKRKPIISIDGNNNRKTQNNRISPAVQNIDDDFDEDDEDPDDEDYDDGEDEQADDDDSNINRYSSNDDDEENDENGAGYYEQDDEEEDEEPVNTQKVFKNRQTANRRQPVNTRNGYDYDEDDYEDDDDNDDDYDYIQSNINSGRKQQQQSIFNRFRQLAQFPYSSNNKQQNNANEQSNVGYRPVRIVQNGQVLQLIEDEPTKPKRRPSSSQNTFQLIPIRGNQLSNAGQSNNPKRKRLNKPDPTTQIVIPIPQDLSSSSSGQKRPSQYITIPWSQLGLSNPNAENAQSNQQAAPIIVNIPHQALQQNKNTNQRRRPMPYQPVVSSAPKRKRLRRPTSYRPKSGQVVSLLTDQNIRDIFRVPEIPPSRSPPEENKKRKSPIKTSNVSPDENMPNQASGNVDANSEMDDDEDESQNENQSYIMVGEDENDDEALPRHGAQQQVLHFGGIKPFVDVLNKGRVYLKSERQIRTDAEGRPESKITLLGPDPMFTTESSSETKANAPPTILFVGTEDASTTGNPMPR